MTRASLVDVLVSTRRTSGSPDPSIGTNTYSIRWTGLIEPLYSETYTIYTVSDDGIRVWIDGQLVVDSWVDQSPTEHSGAIALQAGQLDMLSVELAHDLRGEGVAEFLKALLEVDCPGHQTLRRNDLVALLSLEGTPAGITLSVA